jgi:hypothetical protein
MNMTDTELTALRRGFNDELEKIAGFSRSGVRPFKASTLLAKKKLVKKATMSKMSSGESKSLLKGKGKALALLATGALAGDQLKKAKDDWRMGREVRRQQGM